MQETEEIAWRHLALDTGVDQLVEDGGTVPSLLVQLDDARLTRTGPGGSTTTSGRVPFHLDASAFLIDVQAVVGKCSIDRLAERLRTWASAQHFAAPEVLDQAVEQVDRWVARARDILDPHPPWRMRGASCPECGEHFETRPNYLGEEVQRGVLEVRLREAMIRCVLCGECWTQDSWAKLAELVAEQTQHEVLAIED